MSHEIRTPMNGVYASLQLLNRSDMPFAQKELVHQSLFSCECLLTIINDILDFSKIESGKLEIEHIAFSIRNTVESVLSDVMPLIDQEKVSLSFSCQDNLWDVWQGDPVRVKQIVLNLVSNAIKFTKQGKVSISLLMLHQENSTGFSIIVSDTGIGMSDDELKVLFHRFSQANISTTRNFGGTGLGMAITSSLVKMMGGNISVESKKNTGTKATVYLPYKPN